jgi:type I restriction enzyme, S subunit
MTDAATRYMVVSWRDLPRWDIKTARASAFRLANPAFRPLGDFAEEATDLARPWDKPQADWPVYGVNNEVGVVFSHQQRGDTFSAPYKRIRKDWFFHNPTRANVGSLGRVPDVPDDAITSPEYQVWRVTGEVLPAYVEILIQTRYFIEQIACHRVGAVKERLFVGNLLEIPVPILPLPAQRRIVKAYEAGRQAAAKTSTRIEQLRREIESRFLTDLGLKVPAHVTLPRCFAVPWRDLLRWSVSYNQHAQAGADITLGKYPVVALGSCIDLVQYGSSEKANSAARGTPVLRINNVKGQRVDTAELKHLELPEKVRRALLLRDGDILVIRTNGSRDLVGTCAVFHEKGEYVFASYLIRLRPDRAKANPDFIAWFLNSPLGRQQVDATSRQIMQNNINSEELRSLQIPLPPLAVQESMMKLVDAGRAEIAKLQFDAKVLADTAKRDIEATILGTKPGAPAPAP